MLSTYNLLPKLQTINLNNMKQYLLTTFGTIFGKRYFAGIASMLFLLLSANQASAHIWEVSVAPVANCAAPSSLTWYLQSYHDTAECGNDLTAGIVLNGTTYYVASAADIHAGAIPGGLTLVSQCPLDGFTVRTVYVVITTPNPGGTLTISTVGSQCWTEYCNLGAANFTPPSLVATFNPPNPICTTETNATILDLDNSKVDPGAIGTWTCPSCPVGLFNTTTAVLTPSGLTNPTQSYAFTFTTACASDTKTITFVNYPALPFDAPSSICTSETNATILDLDNYLSTLGAPGTWACPTCPGGLFNTATGVLNPSVVTNPPQLYAFTFTPPCTNTAWTEYIAIVSCSQSCGVELAGVENPLCNTDGAYTVYDSRVLDGVTLTAPGAGSSANVIGTFDVFADTSFPLTTDLTAIGGSGFVDNGNGTLTINPALITYANSGFYTIRYTIDDTAAPFDNCDGAVYFEVFELYPTYNPAFTLQTNACTTDGNITLALTTTPNPVPAGVTADDIEDWYGDGVTDAAGTGGTFSPSTAGAGVHTVCVDVGATTCIATYCQTITVYGAPSASATNTGPYCTGDPIQLNASGGASFSWNGPSGYTSTQQNPSNATLAGVYTVTVTQGNNCTSTASTTVIIYSD
jgi:hypothetical protein